MWAGFVLSVCLFVLLLDASAEEDQQWVPLRCRLGFFSCKDGSDCVLSRHVCDGERDCTDGSDEDECAVECSKGQFQCAHGKLCIEKSQVCDGSPQCQDRSDELGCIEQEDCEHLCDRRCLPKSFVCDGQVDCEDGSDEAACGDGSCGSTEFQCTSGQCVSSSVRCDGHSDCSDLSDEANCINWTECYSDQYRCPPDQECLQEWICDEDVCKERSDQQDCSVSPVRCGELQWRCTSQNQCIPQNWYCDGTQDCTDKSDEAECMPVCPPHQFQCSSLDCLDPSLLCDGKSDCVDGSDEGGACLTDTCSSQSQCAQDCYSTPTGPRCWCRQGYRPVDGAVGCVDVDECVETPAVCAHSCVNSDGSFRCSCGHGYVLQLDDRNCNVTGESYLLASVQSDLWLLDLQNSSLNTLLSDGQPVVSLDYDWQDRRVFWVDEEAETVEWITLDRRSRGTLVRGVKVDSVAVDWVGRSLYWMDRMGGVMKVVALEGSEPVVVVEDVSGLRSLALLPQRGLMFWSETGEKGQIERAGMDGSDRRVLMVDSVSWPVGLAVDLLQERLYWTDERLRCIGSSTLDGGDVQVVQLMESPSPFSLSVFGEMIYWSDTLSRTVQRAQKETGKQREVLLRRLGQPFSLKVLHSSLQQQSFESPCVTRCSHLCVLAPDLKGVCKCPSGLQLEEDGHTCSKNSTFLLLLSPTAVTRVSLDSRSAGVGLQDWPRNQRLDLPGVMESRLLDLTAQNQTLYVWDAGRAALRFFRVKDMTVDQTGTVFSLLDTLSAVAVDWVTRNLYWSSSGRPGLWISSAQGTQTAVILQDEVRNVSSITLQPLTGLMCFSNGVQLSRTQLECSYMNGQNWTVVWADAVQPVSLSLCKKGTTLYWADTALGVIASVRTDGSRYKDIKTEEGLQNFALADSVLFWVTTAGSTKCWLSDDQQRATLWFEVEETVVDVKAVSKASQRGGNWCSNGNGGCAQLCLPYPGGRSCRCAGGFVSVKETGCVLDNHCPAGTQACVSGHECVSQKKLCDGRLDCSDHSDEICKDVRAHPDGPPASPAGPSSLNTDWTSLRPKLPAPEVKGDVVKSQEVSPTRGASSPARPDQDSEVEVKSVDSDPASDGEVWEAVQGPAVYAAGGLCVAVVVLGVTAGVLRKRRAASRRRRAAQRDTRLRDLEKTGQSSSQTDRKDPEHTEVEASAMD